MENELHQRFIEQLTHKYGSWQKSTSKFGNTPFGKIADDLCISTSQFSKLISGTATEGMYVRSIKNIDQLMVFELNKNKIEELQSENERLNNSLKELSLGKSNKIRSLVMYAFMALFISALVSVWFLNSGSKPPPPYPSHTHPLASFFDRNYNTDHVSPFLSEAEAQNYCPCSAYEGIWELEQPYTIPLPGKKPGVYYKAKSSDMRVKCLKTFKPEKKGKVLIGFERMHHEIWIDKNRTPLSKEYFDESTKTYTTAFFNLDFEHNAQFAKVADIYSFFIDEFVIYPDSIIRHGEPCGRYADNINQDLANRFEIDVKDLLEDVIGNMTSTDCQPALNKYCDPNMLQEQKSTITFDCLFSIKTENLGIGGGYPYTKGFRLVKQNYSDNLLCDCNEGVN